MITATSVFVLNRWESNEVFKKAVWFQHIQGGPIEGGPKEPNHRENDQIESTWLWKVSQEKLIKITGLCSIWKQFPLIQFIKFSSVNGSDKEEEEPKEIGKLLIDSSLFYFRMHQLKAILRPKRGWSNWVNLSLKSNKRKPLKTARFLFILELIGF